MKIAIFTENEYKGGLDTFITNLINYWPNADDELVLICNRDHPGLETVAENLSRDCAVIAHRIPLDWVLMRWANKMPDLLRKVLSVGFRYFFFLSYLPQLRRLFNRLAPDRLLIVNGGYPPGTCRRPRAVDPQFSQPRRKHAVVGGMDRKPDRRARRTQQ